MTLSARRSPCTRESPAHTRSDSCSQRTSCSTFSSDQRPMSPARSAYWCLVSWSRACSLRQPVKSSASWSSVRGSVCPGRGSASASAPTASATARRSSGFQGSSGERPCTTSKPRITQSPSSDDHRSVRRRDLRGQRAGHADLGAGEVGGDRVLLAGDGLDEDAAPVGELEHRGETGAEAAGRADLGRDLSARQLGDPGPDVPREVAPVQPLAAEGEREGNDVVGTHAAHPASSRGALGG